MSGNDNKKNNISDEELSLISIIANLENKLEELDHNISLLSKDNAFEKMNSDSNNVIFKKFMKSKIIYLKLTTEYLTKKRIVMLILMYQLCHLETGLI